MHLIALVATLGPNHCSTSVLSSLRANALAMEFTLNGAYGTSMSRRLRRAAPIYKKVLSAATATPSFPPLGSAVPHSRPRCPPHHTSYHLSFPRASRVGLGRCERLVSLHQSGTPHKLRK